jgi:guanylate kinase
MSKGICLVLSAPSGGGKTTLIRALETKFPNLRHSISYTTRNPREDSTDLHDYHFISEVQFRQLVADGEFLEWAEVHSFLYGTRRSDLESLLEQGFDVILDIDVQGSAQFKQKFPDAVHVFIMPPSLEILEARLRARKSETEEMIQKRLNNARSEIKAFRRFDYIIINDDLDSAIDRIRSILIAEHCRATRLGADLEDVLEGKRINP